MISPLLLEPPDELFEPPDEPFEPPEELFEPPDEPFEPPDEPPPREPPDPPDGKAATKQRASNTKRAVKRREELSHLLNKIPSATLFCESLFVSPQPHVPVLRRAYRRLLYPSSTRHAASRSRIVQDVQHPTSSRIS